jgi:hypothetical protein
MWSRLPASDSYVALFVAILITYLATVVGVGGRWNRLVLSVCFGGVLVLAMYTSLVRGRALRIAIIVAFLPVAVSFLHAVEGSVVVLERGSYVYLAPAFAAPVAVLNRVLRHPVINFETIMGAVDAYLLIGLAFAVFYATLNAVDTHYFFVQSTTPAAVDFVYFSFVVLTTVGFGDLTPRTPIGKVVVPGEALLGQIFLVTIVAALVGNLGRQRPGRSQAEETQAGDT